MKKADGTNLDFTFFKTEDPLIKGQSSQSEDYIIIDNDNTEKIITVSSEEHTLNELYAETLFNRGVDTSTIVVKNSNGVEWLSPLSSSTPDYIVETNDYNYYHNNEVIHYIAMEDGTKIYTDGYVEF